MTVPRSPRWNVHRGGTGEPLVLIHGVGHHWRAWTPVLPAIEQDFDVWATDSPGFGDSAPLPAGASASVVSYATAFERFFADHGLDRPHVAGNSMGGGIALELARRGAVRSATAFSPVGFWTSRGVAYCQRSIAAIDAIPTALRPAIRAALRSSGGRRALLAQIVARPAALPADLAVGSLEAVWNAESLHAALAAFGEYRCAPLPADAPPTTVAWGKHDRLLVHRTQARRARAVLTDAVHLDLDAGHVPCSDDPVGVANAIRATASR